MTKWEKLRTQLESAFDGNHSAGYLAAIQGVLQAMDTLDAQGEDEQQAEEDCFDANFPRL